MTEPLSKDDVLGFLEKKLKKAEKKVVASQKAKRSAEEDLARVCKELEEYEALRDDLKSMIESLKKRYVWID